MDLLYEQAPDVPALLVGDEGRVRQVVVNLVGNAVKFTERGEIVVSVAVEERSGDSVTVAFSVRDTGIGILEHLKTRIFAAFAQADTSSTRQFGGTGLGLTISSEIVGMMGGRLGVESTLGQGSTFRFAVKLQMAAAEGADASTKPAALEGRAALIVDDNATSRRLLSEYLRWWGARPVAVGSIHEGLEEVLKARAGGRPFDVVIVDGDLQAPDGRGLAERLAAPEFGNPDVIAVSSKRKPDRSSAWAARPAGVASSGYLARPLFPGELREALERRVRVLSFEAAAAERAPATAEQQAHRKVRILLAEDNKVNQMLAVALLKKRGYDVTIADNGREAVDLVKRSQFDAVLMDVQTPELDGFEATALIRAMEAGTAKRLPIIAVTAHAMEGDRQRCLDAGMDDYVSKPLDPERLEAAIVRWTGRLADFEHSRALDLAAGDEGVLEQIVRIFLDKAPDRLEAIHRALDARDGAGLERTAHLLEDAAVSLAMPRIRDIAHRIAVLGKRGELAQAAQLIIDLDEAVGSGTSAVRELISVA
ncbi:MAG: response regulator [Gemmatimonadetes bacterium]|nr:response regulator [Gemmatimonadota bacterium]